MLSLFSARLFTNEKIGFIRGYFISVIIFNFRAGQNDGRRAR